MAKSHVKSTPARSATRKRSTKKMAKKHKQGESNQEGETQAEPQASAGSQNITVDGLGFTIPAPYAQGHILTENEASALNQVFGENIRNNFAKKVKGAKEAHKTETGSDELSEEIVAGLQADISSYAAGYAFGKRTPGSASVPKDPVLREAQKIAKATLDTKLREKGIAKASLAEGRYDELVATLVAKDPSIMDEAKRRVHQLKQVASSSIEDLLDLGQSETQAQAAE